MITYLIMALAVAFLAGLTGAMPGPVTRVPRSGPAEDSEADTDAASDRLAGHLPLRRRLPSEILNALAEAQRVSDRRYGSGAGGMAPPIEGTAKSVRARWDRQEDDPPA
jgi:hypothetical protein